MKYSQNREDEVIGSYFNDCKGHLLSLGENDGVTLSNSRKLILEGWSADLVEPAARPFKKLFDLYMSGNSEGPCEVQLHNVAIGNANTEMEFYESGTLLNDGDTDLVSTLSPTETKRWQGAVDFQITKVKVITVDELLNRTMNSTFDFVSIDCEGFDLDILRQMDFKHMGTKCVCVEFNGQNEWLYTSHVKQFGMRLIHKNAENLIYVL